MTEPRLQWDDRFLIGIDELDFEHKRLIEDINRLHGVLSGQDEMPDVEACLGEIFARMQAHFALEERVMRRNKYPGFDEHKREHEALLDSYTASMLDFINSPGSDRGRPIEDTLERWIVDHILVSDRKMSAMIAASK